jgi:hypothetical protein
VFDSNYPDMPGDLLAGVEADAVIMFDALSPSETVRFIWDGPQLSNFRLTFRPYEWTVGP